MKRHLLLILITILAGVVLTGCRILNVIYFEDVIVESDADLLEFNNITAIFGGDLHISGDVHSLLPLQDLKVVVGRIRIEDTLITTLSGLNSLEFASWIYLYDNELLTNIQALSNVHGKNWGLPSLEIMGCNSLSSLDGLENLHRVDFLNIGFSCVETSFTWGPLFSFYSCTDYYINGNDSLEDISALLADPSADPPRTGLTYVGRSIFVGYNENLCQDDVETLLDQVAGGIGGEPSGSEENNGSCD